MPTDDGRSRFLASCDRCGSVYAATETADGTVLPIGPRAGCSCGGTTFSRLEAVDRSEGPDDDESSTAEMPADEPAAGDARDDDPSATGARDDDPSATGARDDDPSVTD